MKYKFFNKKDLDNTDYSELLICQIADVIISDWTELANEKNKHILELVNAMKQINYISDQYYLDSGINIVVSFLAYTNNWKTYSSKIIKAELKKRIENLNKQYGKLRD